MANNKASNAPMMAVSSVMQIKNGRRPCVQPHANAQKLLGGVVIKLSGKGLARFSNHLNMFT